MTVVKAGEYVAGEAGKALMMLMGAVGFLLLVACSNVASLIVWQGLARRRELAIRSALGANRPRLVMQLTIESVLLWLLGGVLAICVVRIALELILRAVPSNIPRIDEIAFDWRVLSFALVLTLVTGLVFGVIAALQASKLDLHSALKAGDPTRHHLGRWFPKLLLVSEIGLAMVLLVGGGVVTNSFIRIMNVDYGFDKDDVLTLQLTNPVLRTPGEQSSFAAELEERARQLPNVIEAGVIDFLPLSETRLRRRVPRAQFCEGCVSEGDSDIVIELHSASAGYFRTLGIRILKGNGFVESEMPQAVISESLARVLWPGQEPIGRKIRDRQSWVTVVGVVSDVRHHGPLEEPVFVMHRPFSQRPQGTMGLVVRTSSEPLSVAPVVRSAILAVDRRTVILVVKTLDESLSDAVAQPRFYALLMGWFASTATLLAGLGLYGLLAQSVAVRTAEVGLRMAIGARRTDILRLVIGQGMALALIGIAVGLAAAIALGRFLSSLLYEVSPADPLTLASVALLFFVITLTACYVPARRAAKLDPSTALRYE